MVELAQGYRIIDMLDKLLQTLGRGGVQVLDDLSQQLGITRPLLEAMISDLERMGYLKKVEQACNQHCTGCASSNLCALVGSSHVWTLTEKGQRAVARQTQ